jgi:hypothetical protein
MFRTNLPSLRSMTSAGAACAFGALAIWSGMALAAPPPIKLSEPVDVNVVGEPDRSVEIQRPGDALSPECQGSQGCFVAHRVVCTSSPNSCLAERDIGAEGFLLHYVSFSVAARDSIGCGAFVSLVGRTESSGIITEMLQITTAGDATEATTLALPVPIRLRPGDTLQVGATDAAAGGRCYVNAIFGGVQPGGN